MSHEIPNISSQPLPVRALRDLHGCFRVPAWLTESVGEIGRFNVGRRSVVVVNSGQLTRIAFADHADAFVPISDAPDCAWRLLSSGAVLKAGQFHRAPVRAGGRGFAGALHAQVDAAAAMAERLWAKRKVGDKIDLDQELVRLTRWISMGRLFKLDDMPDVAEEIAGALAAYGASFSGRTLVDSSEGSSQAAFRRRVSVRRLRRALQRATWARRTTCLPESGDFLAPLSAAAAVAGGRDADIALSIELTSALVLSLETIRSVMNTIWRRLAEYPDVRSRLHCELDQALQGRTPQYRDLRRLPYALSVIRETLRLDPPVVMFSRMLARDVQLGSYRVPAGSIMVFNTRRVHRCASLFTSADVFNPDRFDATAGKATQAASGDLPLGDPTRSVVDRYVWSLTHIVLATLAQRISLVPIGTSYAVSAVRSEQRPAEIRIQRGGRRWCYRPATLQQPAPLRFEAPPREQVQGQAAKATVAGSANLILTCEALRAAAL